MRVLVLGSQELGGIALDAVTDIPDMKSVLMSKQDPKFVMYNNKIFEKFGSDINNRDYTELFKLEPTNEPNLLFVNPAMENINNAVDLNTVDVIINTSLITDPYYLHVNPNDSTTYNVMIASNMCELINKHCKKNHRPFIIDFSNTHIYDGVTIDDKTPITEEQKIKPLTDRARTINQHEQTLMKQAKEYKIPYTIWRLSTVLGESSSRSSFPSRVAMSIFNGNDIVIEGNGKQCRDYVSSNVFKQNIKDTVTALVVNDDKNLKEKMNGQIYNFGMGEPNKYPIRTLVGSMFSLLKNFNEETGWRMPDIVSTGWRFGKKQNELFDIWVDTKKATKDLPYNVRHPTSFLLANHLMYIANIHSHIEDETLKVLIKWLQKAATS